MNDSTNDADGPILLPFFGFGESAHVVDGKVANWVKLQFEKQLQQEQKKQTSNPKSKATLQGLIKKIKDKRLTFSVKVPHAMTLRQLWSITLDTDHELSAYVQRQCTRDQVQRWYTQMNIIRKKKSLDNIKEQFINDDAFSTTPLPAMEEVLKVMMPFHDLKMQNSL